MKSVRLVQIFWPVKEINRTHSKGYVEGLSTQRGRKRCAEMTVLSLSVAPRSRSGPATVRKSLHIQCHWSNLGRLVQAMTPSQDTYLFQHHRRLLRISKAGTCERWVGDFVDTSWQSISGCISYAGFSFSHKGNPSEPSKVADGFFRWEEGILPGLIVYIF